MISTRASNGQPQHQFGRVGRAAKDSPEACDLAISHPTPFSPSDSTNTFPTSIDPPLASSLTAWRETKRKIMAADVCDGNNFWYWI
jgi:hypothetical protein